MSDVVTHLWKNGCIVSTDRFSLEDGTQWVGLRIQDENERMLVDIQLGDKEAVTVAQALLTAVLDDEVV